MGGGGQELIHMPLGVFQGQLTSSRLFSLAREPFLLSLVVQDGDGPHQLPILVSQWCRTADDLHLVPIERAQPNLACVRSCHLATQYANERPVLGCKKPALLVVRFVENGTVGCW